MDFNEYQAKTHETAIYKQAPAHTHLAYLVSKLCSEAGEVGDQYGKAIRDDHCDGCNLPPERKENMIKELGDVLWYVAQTADYLGTDLETVAGINLEKLRQRHNKN